MIKAPRGHLKTSLTTAWIFQLLIRHRNIRVFLLSASYDRACDTLEDVKLFMIQPWCLELFPRRVWANPFKDAPTWTHEQAILPRDNAVSGASIRAQSIYGKMTGQHYEVIVLDDPQDDENTKTVANIDRVKTKIRNAMSVLNPGGWFVFIGTPWSRDDVLAWIDDMGFTTYCRSAVLDKLTGENARLPEEGEEYRYDLLFPKKYTFKELREVKAIQGKMFFSGQYELDFLPDEAVAFKEEWFVYQATPNKDLRKVYILCEPAISRSAKADDSVILTAVQPLKGPICVAKSRGFRGSVQDVVNALFDEYLYWKKQGVKEVGVWVETGAYQHALKQWIEKDQKSRHVYFMVGELKHGGRKKATRIGALQPMFENSGITLNKLATEDLRRQLLNYDGSPNKHDDHADCLAYLPDILEGSMEFQSYETILYPETDVNSLEYQIAQMESDQGRPWHAY